ncbi:MAG TPA: hypothetical protein VHO70_16590, partial [Chitinispirillaceae bacterium]|nr:hypothetical protein [Chitinispirillaceae bacterium]
TYVRTMGYRAFLNLVNLNIIGIRNFNISNNMKMNIGMGHTMCPFGDFIDENVWLTYKDKLQVDGYIREFQNRDHWFVGAGIGINDYPMASRFNASMHVHLWNQPENLGFNDTRGQFGGAVEVVGKYFMLSNQKTRLKAFSIDIGLLYKTVGFLPEEIYLRRHFGIRMGTSFVIDK